MRPPNALDLSDEALAVSIAVLSGARTVRAVRDVVGGSVSTVSKHLHEAREVGLVDFQSHKAGTLRPAVKVVQCAP